MKISFLWGGAITISGDQIIIDRTEYENFTNAAYYNYIERSEPEVYSIRNPSGDWHLEFPSNDNALIMPSPGLEISVNNNTGGLNSIDLTSITFQGIIMLGDVKVWWVNYIKE